MNVGSLFSGIGGLDLGLERAGMTVNWQVEIDEYATKVLERRFPGVRRWKDVCTFPPDRTRDCWNVDLIAGGFPCQDISYAGKGAGLDGERSGLFYESMRVVRTLAPRYVLLENVAALLTRGMDDVLGTLASLGYDAEWHCIQAADFGAPHIRDRVFIIGRKRESMPSAKSVSDANRKRLPQREGQDTSGAGAILRAQPSRSRQWDVEPGLGRVAHGIPNRVDRLRGLGNAVVPQVAEFIGREIMKYDRNRNRTANPF